VPSHGTNRGSNPLRDAKQINYLVASPPLPGSFTKNLTKYAVPERERMMADGLRGRFDLGSHYLP
jgi:hypothetical protein